MIYSFLIAIIADYLIGAPQSWPHPVRLVGRIASFIDKSFSKRTFIQGLLGLFMVLFTCFLPVLILDNLLNRWPILSIVGRAYLIYSSFALGDLIKHGKDVQKAVEADDIPTARKRLSYLVSRDTEAMNEDKIITSTVESLSENFLDSVLSPLLFLLFFGPLGAWFFRIVNTLDAMWGYKKEGYYRYGTCAARLDDMLNIIPSRIAIMIILPVGLLLGGSYSHIIEVYRRDKGKHDSPNSGYTESLASGILNISLGGPTPYFGRMEDKPVIGTGKADKSHIKRMINLLKGSALFFYVVILLLLVIKGVILS
ncbi:adenosylcobinamide-phosphate synthase CbiB [Spirochaeta cellobiosiphila]|uniref:adenosylcobinamide-phosphate synthase CbiB n=1 Tax=Spirochaeta cellobiosiphila TaxID=504483 RepID=UPI000407D57A|nr:adenosylcobinamide-phosphate synthase CbiB [Spirochaeta cellobiosiphila]